MEARAGRDRAQSLGYRCRECYIPYCRSAPHGLLPNTSVRAKCCLCLATRAPCRGRTSFSIFKTQRLLGLGDEALEAVPVLQTALAAAINNHKDAYHSPLGTVMTALAFVVGEFVLGRVLRAKGAMARSISEIRPRILTRNDFAPSTNSMRTVRDEVGTTRVLDGPGKRIGLS